MGKANEIVKFAPGFGSASHVVDEIPFSDMNIRDHSGTTVEQINVVRLDDVVGDEVVGFIKMDVESAECDALEGAQRTIVRDKPLLAISVYHRSGDQLAIMDYLHSLVSEYRFWLRHYGDFPELNDETVLYAAV